MGCLKTLQIAGDWLFPAALRSSARRLVGKDYWPAWLDADWFRRHGVAFTAPKRPAGTHRLREALKSSLEGGLLALLRYEDRNSMAFSIESRVPFLTPRLVQFSLSLPEQYLVAPDGTSKQVLRKALEGILPPAILARKDKIGFATPEARWLKDLRPWVDRVFRGDEVRRIPALNRDALLRAWESIRGGSSRGGTQVWRWLNLAEWSRRVGAEYGDL
jgi:asparagine synthase (glutamine-hydrolysing)